MSESIQAVREALSESNFSRELNLSVEEIGRNSAVCFIPLEEKLLNAYGTVHGGAYYTLADSTGAAALMGMVGVEVPVATIEGKLNYLASVSPDDTQRLIGIADVLHFGQQTAVVEIEVTNEESTTLCKGLYTYAIKDGET